MHIATTGARALLRFLKDTDLFQGNTGQDSHGGGRGRSYAEGGGDNRSFSGSVPLASPLTGTTTATAAAATHPTATATATIATAAATANLSLGAVILLSPEADLETFVAQSARMETQAESITIYGDPHDGALFWSELANGYLNK
jgi:hypothetical protein